MGKTKSTLELVVENLINENQEVAERLFHEFIVSKAREIHQSLVTEDEELDEMGGDESGVGDHELDNAEDQIADEEYFGEDDLEGEEEDMDAEEEGDEVDSEMHTDVDMDGEEEDVDVVDDVDGMHTDVDMDMHTSDEEEEDVAAKVADLEAEFARLEAEFEALRSEEHHDEHEMADALDEGDAGVYGTSGGGDDNWEPNEMGDSKPGYGEPKGVYESEELDVNVDSPEADEMADAELDEWEDLEEGQAMDYLSHPATTDKKDGDGAGAGGYDAKGPRVSPIPQRKVEDRLTRATPESMFSKQSTHKGYDRENAPPMKDPPYVGQNTFQGNKELQTHITHEGGKYGKAAELNKVNSDGFGAVQTTSPIGSKNTGGNRAFDGKRIA